MSNLLRLNCSLGNNIYIYMVCNQILIFKCNGLHRKGQEAEEVVGLLDFDLTINQINEMP